MMQRKSLENAQEIYAALNARTLPVRNQKKSELQAAQDNQDQETLNDIYAHAKELFKQKFIELCLAAGENISAEEKAALTKTGDSKLGFDPTESDNAKTGRTILYWAIATQQSQEELDLIITLGNEKKENYTVQSYFGDGGGRSILAAALEVNNETAIEVLLKDNKKLATETLHQSGNMPAHYLIESKKHSALECLLRNAPTAAIACTGTGTSPLHLATESHNAEAGIIIIDHVLEIEGGKDYLDQPDNEGHTALHKAASNGNEGLVTKLIAAGANPCIVTTNKSICPNKTALQVAAQNGQNEILRIFMHNGYRENSNHKLDRSNLNETMRCALGLIDYINECDTSLRKTDSGDSPKFDGKLSQATFFAASLVTNNPQDYTPGHSKQRKRDASQNLLDKILEGNKDPWAAIGKEDQATLKNSNYTSKYLGSMLGDFLGSTSNTSAITRAVRHHSNSNSSDEELELNRGSSPGPSSNH